MTPGFAGPEAPDAGRGASARGERCTVTGADTLLARALTTALGADRAPGDLRDQDVAARAVEGVDTLFHLAPLWPDLSSGTLDHELLDHASRGTYVLLTAAVRAGVRRVVLASTLDLFEAYPEEWWVSEAWQPRPTSDTGQIAAHLAECSAREISRVEPLHVICLRLGHVVDGVSTAGRVYDPRWLHVEDAVQAFRRAVKFDLSSPQFATTGPALHGWWVFHIPGGGAHTRLPLAHARQPRFGYAPLHTFAESGEAPAGTALGGALTAAAAGRPGAAAVADRLPGGSRATHTQRSAQRPIRNVVVFGAGGPLASATASILAARYALRLTDLRALREIAADPRANMPGRPSPPLLGPPHELREVDVSDPEQVLAACEGMDAIVNCSVVRPHPVGAFRVNTVGAYNIARAAVAHGIRRVVQTGPQQVTLDRPGGYWWDFGVPDDAPARPGSLLYSHSKYLGQEVLRIFAEQHDLEIPVLLFSRFVDPAVNRPNIDGMFPMTVSWNDAGHAIRCALEAPLPHPFEVFHILADLPHGKYSNEKARRLLGWQPQDTLQHLWGRRHTLEEEGSR